jgi:anti-sigma regulatory factor (Ser/Thr protein kinase)
MEGTPPDQKGPPVQTREEVPNGPEAPARARRLLDRFESRIPEELMIDVRLVLSEIVTNSYKHAGNPPGSPIEVTVTDSHDRLRVEVIDRSIFDPTPETPQELRSAKWGLYIVDHLADQWGRITEGGIWAEFDIADQGSIAAESRLST